MEQPRGTVRIAAFQSAALTIVPQALKELRRLHPLLTVEFEQGEPETTLPALASSEFDLVIAESYPGLPISSMGGIMATTILEDPLWLVMDATIAATLDPKKNIIAQLADTAWAVEAKDSASRTWVINECRKAGFDPKVICSSEDLSVNLRFVEAGLAVAVLPGLALVGADPTVRRFPAAPGVQTRKVLVATREASGRRAAIVAVSRAVQRATQAYPSDIVIQERSHDEAS
jgi:DNA-binding transcriptional LysR family regulator